MNILLSLRSEILKTKRTAALYFTLIGAAVVPLMFLLNACNEGLPDEEKSNKDPLNAIFQLANEMNGLAFFPFFIILVCTLLPQIEHRNNTWKQVLTSPKTKLNVYLTKFLFIQLMILFFLVANHFFMWLVAIAIHFILRDLNLLQQPLDGYSIFVSIINSYIAMLAVVTIQFWIGLRCKNFLVPIAIGFGLWLMGTILTMEYHVSFANYFPYAFHIFPIVPKYQPQLNQVALTSLGYGALILFLGYFDFSRK